jgi:hypothetical protein
MTEYLCVVKHVGYWRGVIHRWSTAYPYVGSAALSGTTVVDAVADRDSGMCFGSAADGGIFESSLYDVTAKGSPIETHTYFDYLDTSAWTGYTSAGYFAVPSAEAQPLELALLASWYAGMSRTGKPVFFKKWYHAVGETAAAVSGAADVTSANVASLGAYGAGFQGLLSAHGLAMGNARRLVAVGEPGIGAFFENHQIPKGRKRKPLA